MRKFFATSVAALSAIAMLNAPAAHAFVGKDLDNLTIENQKALYTDGDTVTVSVDGLTPGKDYIVGQCAWDTYTTFGFFQVPACAEQNRVTATADKDGKLTATITLLDVARNAHKKLPGQPKQLNFIATPAEILVTYAHGEGKQSEHVADSAGVFHVNPK